mmetsp:Transcript_36995/g.116485  ORF Transcript_36995/g.116485 Transcript_36995/m.116485 type:complete len:307 (+) Transcript_36995:831-1751(+)
MSNLPWHLDASLSTELMAPGEEKNAAACFPPLGFFFCILRIRRCSAAVSGATESALDSSVCRGPVSGTDGGGASSGTAGGTPLPSLSRDTLLSMRPGGGPESGTESSEACGTRAPSPSNCDMPMERCLPGKPLPMAARECTESGFGIGSDVNALPKVSAGRETGTPPELPKPEGCPGSPGCEVSEGGTGGSRGGMSLRGSQGTSGASSPSGSNCKGLGSWSSDGRNPPTDSFSSVGRNAPCGSGSVCRIPMFPPTPGPCSLRMGAGCSGCCLGKLIGRSEPGRQNLCKSDIMVGVMLLPEALGLRL